jgi:hypothetical protein
MEIEATATTEVTETAVSVVSGTGADADGFGTRPRTDRPHSISLSGPHRTPVRDSAWRGLDVLLGVGIGAAVMYYFDPDGGPRRRAAVRDKIVGTATMAPDAFEATVRDISRWTRQTLDVQARRLPRAAREVGAADWTPGSRLVASAVGGALTLLAGKRRDALGAAIGLLGSALLARGVTGGKREEGRGMPGPSALH